MTQTAPAETRRSTGAVWLVLLLMTVAAVYARAVHFQFLHWDDDDLLVQNPLLHPANLANLQSIWTAPYAGLYTPLSYTLWWLILHVRPMSDATVFHTLNLLLHLFSTGMVFVILRKCVRSPSAAFAGAAVFALHPLQVESVAWISQTNGLLAAAFSLVAIDLYLRYAARPRRIMYLAASAAFLLAMLAKPSVVVVPLAAAILDYYFLRRPSDKILRTLLPWFVASLAFALAAHHIQSAPGIHPPPYWKRFAVAADALAFYAYKIFWPAHLTIDYVRTPAVVLATHRWIAAVAAVFLAIAIWPRLGRLRPGLLLMVACLLPVLGFASFDFQRYSTVADRYMYLPMLGVAVAAAMFPRPLILLLAVLLAFKTESQLSYWQDTSALANHTLALDPTSTIGNKIRGEELAARHDYPAAARAFSTALVRNPGDGDLHFNLANALRAQGDFEAAIDEYLTAIHLLRPDLRLRAMNNLGIAYYQAGDPGLSESVFLQILRLDPHNRDARQNLAQLFTDVPSQ
jgi:tetratricopeptide (TPR) repeat protein